MSNAFNVVVPDTLPPALRTRLFTMFEQTVNGHEALSKLLADHPDMKVVVIMGSARLKPMSRVCKAVRRFASTLGPNVIVVTGGGPGVMDAASKGAKDGGSIVVGLSLHASKSFETQHKIGPSEFIDVELPFGDFGGRLDVFQFYADVIVFFRGGLGSAQESSTFESATQNGTHGDVELLYALDPVWIAKKVMLGVQLCLGLVDKKDFRRVRLVRTGKISAAVQQSLRRCH